MTLNVWNSSIPELEPKAVDLYDPLIRRAHEQYLGPVVDALIDRAISFSAAVSMKRIADQRSDDDDRISDLENKVEQIMPTVS